MISNASSTLSRLPALRAKRCVLKVVRLVCVLGATASPAFACMTISEPLGITICVAETSWSLREEKRDDFLFFNSTNDYAAHVRIFDGGASDGLESARAAQLMASADSEEIQDFAILKAGPTPSGAFLFAARGSVHGHSNIYINTVSVGPTRTLRVTTWRMGDGLTDRDRAVHVAFGRLMKTKNAANR